MGTAHDIKLGTMIGLTSTYFLVQIVVSHVTHSLTLLVSSYQMLYNILSLLACLVTSKMCSEKSLRNTFGWARIEVLGLLFSAVFLVALCFGAVVESLQTLVHISHQDAMHHPLAVLGVGSAGILLNLLCFLLLGGFTHQQASTFLHVQGEEVEVNVVLTEQRGSTKKNGRSLALNFFRDVSGSGMVVICSCLVYFLPGNVALFADPTLSIGAVTLLLMSSYPFLKQSGLMLLQNVPDNIDVSVLKEQLTKKHPTILNVHDLHIWRLNHDKIIATVHIVCMSADDYEHITRSVNNFFRDEGITLVTIQPEFIKYEDDPKAVCILCCAKYKCQALQCCQEQMAATETSHAQIPENEPLLCVQSITVEPNNPS